MTYYLTRVVVWVGPGGAVLHFPAGTVVERAGHMPGDELPGDLTAWRLPPVVVAGVVHRPCVALVLTLVAALES